jgi:hypothetical protein
LNILVRFAKVFEFTCTRFLDLKQAETQTREPKIEAASEKVRAVHAGHALCRQQRGALR